MNNGILLSLSFIIISAQAMHQEQLGEYKDDNLHALAHLTLKLGLQNRNTNPAKNALKLYHELNVYREGNTIAQLPPLDVSIKACALTENIATLLLQCSQEDKPVLIDLQRTAEQCARAVLNFHQESTPSDSSNPEYQVRIQVLMREAYLAFFTLLFYTPRNITLLTKLSQ